MFDFTSIEWASVTAEALVSALIEGLILILIGMWVVWRSRKALNEGRFDDFVLFSFNLIEGRGKDSPPVFGFRTPLTGSLKEIFPSAPLIREIKSAAKKTTNENPIIRLPQQKMHNTMQRHMINFCNRLNVSGQMAALTQQPFVEVSYRLALIYEPSAKAKMFRIIPIHEELIKEIEEVKDELTFGLPYHEERLTTLKAIAEEMIADKERTPEARILAPFQVSAPSYTQ